MDTRNMFRIFTMALVCVIFTLSLIFPSPCLGERPPRVTLETTSSQKLSLTVGRSIIVGSSEPVKRVTLVASEIADALVLTPLQIYLTGKAPGVTNVTVWGADDKVSAVLDLEVSPDTSRLKEMLDKIFPQEKDVLVTATHDSITLSGTVSNADHYEPILKLAEPFFPKKVVNLMKVKGNISPDISQLKEMLHKTLPGEKGIMVAAVHNNITLSGTVSSASGLSQALTLAESFLPKDGKLVNLLEVAGVHQVMLEVRVSEISRGLGKRLGFNWAYLTPHGNFGLTSLNSLTRLLPLLGLQNPHVQPLGSSGETLTDSQRIQTTISEAINAILRFSNNGTNWTAFIDALKEEGLVKVLAEPNLITLSGKAAEFLAGGEFPYPVPQEEGTITIQYKSYGVGLKFTPTVLSNKKISMQVTPEVSDLDYANAVSTGGALVPGLTIRRVSTTIELADGQSFAIAGLLRDDVRQIVSKFPLLGEIPVLGSLFRSTNFQKNETELVVIVTPHLVKPLDMAKQALPTDQYNEPDDFEFYLLGRSEGKGKTKPTNESGLEGNFGHIIPK
jgi:pilus assembly protein CpaC